MTQKSHYKAFTLRKPKLKNTRTPMSIAALFTIAKTWKQHKCPSPDEWIKKMWYIYTIEATRPLKMNEIMPSAVTWMDPKLLY